MRKIIFLIKRYFIWRIPKARKYGIRYFWDKDFRRKIKNKRSTLKGRERYGYNFIKNRKNIVIRLRFRDGNQCFWCGRRLGKDATIDHIKPVCLEPKNNKLSNLRLIHEKCRVERDRLINKKRNEILKNDSK